MFLENVEKSLQSEGEWGGRGSEKIGQVTVNTTSFFFFALGKMLS